MTWTQTRRSDMTRRTLTLFNAQTAAEPMREFGQWVRAMLMAGHRMHLEAKPETRSTAQNSLLWSALTDLSRQVVWHGMKLSPDDWKCMCTAALKKQRHVPGLDGNGFVVLGESTSKMTKAEMTELIEFIHYTGASHGVKWSPASIAQDLNELEQA